MPLYNSDFRSTFAHVTSDGNVLHERYSSLLNLFTNIDTNRFALAYSVMSSGLRILTKVISVNRTAYCPTLQVGGPVISIYTHSYYRILKREPLYLPSRSDPFNNSTKPMILAEHRRDSMPFNYLRKNGTSISDVL